MRLNIVFVAVLAATVTLGGVSTADVPPPSERDGGAGPTHTHAQARLVLPLDANDAVGVAPARGDGSRPLAAMPAWSPPETSSGAASASGSGGPPAGVNHGGDASDGTDDVAVLVTVAAPSNTTCEHACAERSLRCREDADGWAQLNTCDALRHALGCAGGCLRGVAATHPAQMLPPADALGAPPLCFVHAEVAAPPPLGASCSGGASPLARRLCPCAPKPGASENEAAAAEKTRLEMEALLRRVNATNAQLQKSADELNALRSEAAREHFEADVVAALRSPNAVVDYERGTITIRVEPVGGGAPVPITLTFEEAERLQRAQQQAERHRDHAAEVVAAENVAAAGAAAAAEATAAAAEAAAEAAETAATKTDAPQFGTHSAPAADDPTRQASGADHTPPADLSASKEQSISSSAVTVDDEPFQRTKTPEPKATVPAEPHAASGAGAGAGGDATNPPLATSVGVMPTTTTHGASGIGATPTMLHDDVPPEDDDDGAAIGVRDPAALVYDAALLRAVGVLLVASAAGGGLAALTSAPSALGYILAGAVVGPSGFAFSGTADTDFRAAAVAQFGCVFPLFASGMAMAASLRRPGVRGVAKAALFGGMSTAAAYTTVLAVLGFVGAGLLASPVEGILVGACTSLASPGVVASNVARSQRRTLSQGSAGRLCAGVLVLHSLAMAALLAIPRSSKHRTKRALASVPWIAASLVVVVVGVFLTRHARGRALLARARVAAEAALLPYEDVKLLGLVGLCMGMALISDSIGLSLEVGAFAAGVLVTVLAAADAAASTSESTHHKHRISPPPTSTTQKSIGLEPAHVTPHRGAASPGEVDVTSDDRVARFRAAVEPFSLVFGALFFTSLGMRLSLAFVWFNFACVARLLRRAPPDPLRSSRIAFCMHRYIVQAVGVALAVKLVAYTVTFRSAGQSRATSVAAACALTQVTEYSLVFTGRAHAAGLLIRRTYLLWLTAAVASLAISPAIMRLHDLISSPESRGSGSPRSPSRVDGGESTAEENDEEVGREPAATADWGPSPARGRQHARGSRRRPPTSPTTQLL